MPKFKTILLLVFLTLSALCFIAHSNSLHNPFIWDDLGLIVRNPLIQDWHNSLKAFSSDLYAGTTAGSNFYRPIQTLSLIWDYYFWQLNPYGYHLTNILLQILVSFLVFLFLRRIIGSVSISFLSAALFSVSPLNTEVVTYVSGRAEMLMGLFLISSLLLFIKAEDKRHKVKLIYLILSYAAFIMALLSKELSLVFPLVILAYLFYFRRDKFKEVSEKPLRTTSETSDYTDFKKITQIVRRRFNLCNLTFNRCNHKERLFQSSLKKPLGILKPVLPFIIIALSYIALRLTVFNFATLRPPVLTRYPLILRITVLPKVIFTYFKLLILPVGLHMSWELIRPVSFLGIFLFWFALGLICVACWRILFYKRNTKPLGFMFFWSLAFFLPQSGIFPINAFIAEHFIYLSSISFFILAAYLLRRYLRKELFIFSAVGIIVFYGLLTLSRNVEWQDPFVFYKKIIKFSPDSFQAHNNLGLEYEYRNMYQGAVFEYKRALEIKPDLIEARSNLAHIYFKTGRFKDARREYNLVKKSAPLLKLGEIENNLGCIYEVEGFWDKALESYQLALKLDPKLNFTRFNIAKIYQAQGKLELSSQEVFNSLSGLKDWRKRRDDYLAMLNKYLKSVKITSAVTFYNDLGIAFANQGLFQAAVVSFKRSLELEPRYADACFNLGLAYWKMGLKREAIFAFKAALRINPNHLKAKGFLVEIIYPVRGNTSRKAASNGVCKK